MYRVRGNRLAGAHSANRATSGRSFVEMLIIMVVVVGGFVYFVPQYLGMDSNSGSARRESAILTDAKDVSCRTNLNVIRQTIVTKKMNGAAPRSLAEAGIASEARCPAGSEEYTYSPESNSVRCPHPGHESF